MDQNSLSCMNFFVRFPNISNWEKQTNKWTKKKRAKTSRSDVQTRICFPFETKSQQSFTKPCCFFCVCQNAKFRLHDWQSQWFSAQFTPHDSLSCGLSVVFNLNSATSWRQGRHKQHNTPDSSSLQTRFGHEGTRSDTGNEEPEEANDSNHRHQTKTGFVVCVITGQHRRKSLRLSCSCWIRLYGFRLKYCPCFSINPCPALWLAKVSLDM